MIQNPGLEVSLNYIIIVVVVAMVIINQLFSTIFFSFFLLLNDHDCCHVFLLLVSPPVSHCPVVDLRHKSLPLQQQHQRGPPPLGFSSLTMTRWTTNTPFSCMTRVIALYPIPESHLFLLLFLLLLLLLLLLLWLDQKKTKHPWILSSGFFFYFGPCRILLRQWQQQTQ